MILVDSSVWIDYFSSADTPQVAMLDSRCIEDSLTLLHADRDFAPFALHLGLREACPNG